MGTVPSAIRQLEKGPASACGTVLKTVGTSRLGIDTHLFRHYTPPMKYSEATQRRFWAKVDKRGPDECWPWTAGLGNGGYGKIKLEKTRIDVQSHVMAFELANGLLPKGKIVCHSCDNPPCCNPRHLWEGTQSQNHADMVKKGRHRTGFSSLVGSRNPHARLNEEQAKEIKVLIAKGMQNTKIAESFPVSHHTISRIRLGMLWKHV